MKICKECTHFIDTGPSMPKNVCDHPNARYDIIIDFDTGDKRYLRWSTYAMRTRGFLVGGCGKRGRFFIEKVNGGDGGDIGKVPT